MNDKPLKVTDVVLRDAHQSLFATRMRLDDMLPIAEKLDQVGFWSLETWGGAVNTPFITQSSRRIFMPHYGTQTVSCH